MIKNSVKPLNTKILFQFVEDVENSKFTGTTKGGLVVIENRENQVQKPRWGKVLATGPEVIEEIDGDSYILIEALGWTTTMELNEDVDEEKFWFTDHEKVLCVSHQLPELE